MIRGGYLAAEGTSPAQMQAYQKQLMEISKPSARGRSGYCRNGIAEQPAHDIDGSLHRPTEARSAKRSDRRNHAADRLPKFDSRFRA